MIKVTTNDGPRLMFVFWLKETFFPRWGAAFILKVISGQSWATSWTMSIPNCPSLSWALPFPVRGLSSSWCTDQRHAFRVLLAWEVYNTECWQVCSPFCPLPWKWKHFQGRDQVYTQTPELGVLFHSANTWYPKGLRGERCWILRNVTDFSKLFKWENNSCSSLSSDKEQNVTVS